MPTPDSPKPPAPNTYWVIPGSFAAGEYPGDFDPARAKSRVRCLLEAGINHFINLTGPNELPPYDEIAQEEARTLDLTVEHQRHTIGDFSIPDSPKFMAATLDAIDSAIAGWQDRLRPLLGRSRAHGNRRRMLASPTRPHRRPGPRPDRRLVAQHGRIQESRQPHLPPDPPAKKLHQKLV